MTRRTLALCLFWCCAALPAGGVIVDRIAIVINNRLVKDSDIERDIRLTDFLNGDKLDFSQAERKKSAQRLMDQRILRNEVDTANYRRATAEEAASFLGTIKKQRFSDNEAAYREALKTYAVQQPDLEKQLEWQLTALNFIDQRFRPAVLVEDAEVEKYYQAHASQFQNVKPEDAHDQIREQLTGARINDAFESWLERARKRATIEYHEEGLR